MSPDATHTDVVVIGAGITGLVAALELLDNGRDVVLLDRCHPEEVGGLAREAFGGMFMVDSPEQRRSGVKDSYELALDAWVGIADLEDAAEIQANAAVIAAGGIGGNLDIVRKEWPPTMGPPPEHILMGSHYYADGALHEEVKRHGGNVTHIDRMWNYADAVRHPKPRRPLHGVKLIPPRSGIMLDPT